MLKILALSLPLLLAGCQGTLQRIADCKSGDWTMIGHKDGLAGEIENFAERREFCANHDGKPEPGNPAASYLAGWAQGNWDFWSGRGAGDGRNALPKSGFERHLASPEVKDHGTPANRAAYEAGWSIGNADYWNGVGKRDGTAGLALNRKEAARADAAARQMQFDEPAYMAGWQSGNRTYWHDAGFSDARNGVPDSELRQRAAAARSAGVQVAEDAYRSAWNAEIVNYWKNLGALDAVSGKDITLRRAEARQKGLKLFETEYRTAWEERLNTYWRQAGHDDGYGKPFLLDERIANARRDGVFVIERSRALYTEAWNAENARYCNVENAFEAGRRRAGMAIEVCQPQQQDRLKRAMISGRDYELAAADYGRASAEADDIASRLHELRGRLGRLEREIRANLDNKDRVPTDETRKQDRRREQDRREMAELLDRLERKLDEARRWADRHQQQMQRLRRDIYLN